MSLLISILKGGLFMICRKRWMALLFLMGIVAVLCSCQTPAGRTAGEVVDDSTITTKVKAKLLADDLLQGIAISVATFEEEVTLTGAVDNDAQKYRASDIARGVNGVKKVNNLLKMKRS
jgi:hyperosmotically inducible protein